VEIRKVGDGAYFIPSYSEQTIQSFHPLFTSQTITTKELDSELIESIEVEIEETKGIFIKPDIKKDSEAWLFKNPEALGMVRRGLKDAAQAKLKKVDLKKL